jgi:hypothetical protein
VEIDRMKIGRLGLICRAAASVEDLRLTSRPIIHHHERTIVDLEQRLMEKEQLSIRCTALE